MTASMQEFLGAGGEILKLVTSDWVGKVAVGIEAAIRQSFETDRVLRPVMTRDEINRRFKICIRWFVQLRKDLGWSVPRILDELPVILRSELDGVEYTPDEIRKGWMTQGQRPFDVCDIGDDDLVGPLSELNDAVEVSGLDMA